ncbi:MAG: hypothetical protein MUC63_09755, partial [Planctomycetes bacterium]|nr:hypothetical protein [Planctomycetota bacterium]
MRTAFAGPLLAALAALPAAAGEFEIKPEATSWVARDVSADTARVEALASPPAGAKAPAGSPAWCRLHAGEKAYLLCFLDIEPLRKYAPQELRELPKRPRAFLDRDGDGDLAEEKPVEGAVNSETMPGTEFLRFAFPDVPARFRVGGAPLDMNVSLGYTVPGRVGLFTVFAGRDPGFPAGVVGSWAPGGGAPTLMLQGSGLWVHECFVGPKKVVVSEDGLKSRGGKMFLSFLEKDEPGLVALSLPPGCKAVVSTPQAGPLPCTPSRPSGDKAHFRPGIQCVAAQFARRLGSDEWVLHAVRRELRVEEGASFGAIEPLSFFIHVQEAAGGGTMLWAWLEDASGEKCTLMKNGKMFGPPRL